MFFTTTINRKILFAAVALNLLLFPRPSSAYTIYSGVDTNGDPSTNLLPNIPNSSAAENAFLANLIGIGTESFESFTNGASGPLPIVFPGAGTATLVGVGNISTIPAGSTNGVGRYGVSPSNFWDTSTSSSTIFEINFSQPVSAFGFYGIDLGDFSGNLNLVFDNGLIPSQSIPLAPQAVADGSVLFWGIITAPSDGDIARILFQTTASADFFGFDNLTIGTRQQIQPSSVPGPLPVLGAGMALAWSRRLRRFAKPSNSLMG